MTFELATFWGLLAFAALAPIGFVARSSLLTLSLPRRLAAMGLRLAVVALLAIALCGPRASWRTSEPAVVLVADVSHNTAPSASSFVADWTAELHRVGAAIRIQELDIISVPAMAGKTPVTSPSNRLAMALAAGRSALPEGFAGRIVLLSDGLATAGDPAAVARRQGVPVFAVPLPSPSGEVYFTAAVAPREVRPYFGFAVELAVASLDANRGRLTIGDGRAVLATQEVQLRGGENVVRVPLELTQAPAGPLVARLEGFDDVFAENNELAIPLRFGPPPRALLVEAEARAGDALAAALRENHIDVTVAPAERLADEKALADCDAVVVCDVPSQAIDAAAIARLRQFVERGGGLVLVGGRRSFTPGGYAESELESLLPLLADAKEKPQSSLALVLVIDVSQSMEGKSLELARQAARKAVDLLSSGDYVGVLVFADEARWASPLARADDKPAVIRRIDGILAGGRTNIASALERADLALRQHEAERRHVVLLTDGLCDPADFRALAERFSADGVTVSTVALGEEPARPMLEDIAQRTGGQFHYCRDAASLPRVFVQETTRAARSGISDTPTRPHTTAAAKDVLAGTTLDKLPTLWAFNETKARPSATVLVETADGQPLLATHRVGKGTVTAFASDAQPRWAAAWLRWDGFPAFWSRVVRHAMIAPAGETQRIVADYGEKYRLRPTNVTLLQEIAQSSGGQFGPTPAESIAPGAATATRHAELGAYLLMLAAGLLVAELAVRRASG